MSCSLKRSSALALAVSTLAAIPLLAPAVANAAMGGAIPLTTTLRPDLRSATLLNVDAPNVETTVRICFNKNIGSLVRNDLIRIGTYRQAERVADRAVRSATNPQCADATFTAPDIDITQHTYVTADTQPGLDPDNPTAGAVVNAANALPNRADSTALIGSNTNNGTAGRTTAPDLTGITATNATDTINFIFDQNVATANTSGSLFSGNGSFAIYDVNGKRDNNLGISPFDPTTGGNVTVANNVVAVRFPANTVTAAVRAVVFPGGVTARTTGNDVQMPIFSAIRPGTSGNTNRPDLLSTSATATTATFVYDELVSIGTPPPEAIQANLPQGVTIGTATIIQLAAATAAARAQQFFVTASDGSVFFGTGTPTFAGGTNSSNGNSVTVSLATSGVAPNNQGTTPVPAPAQTGVAPGNANEYFVAASAAEGAVIGTAVAVPPGADRTSTAGGLPVGGNAGALATGYTTGPEVLRATFNNTTGVVSLLLDQRFQLFDLPRFDLLDDTGAVVATNALQVNGAGGAAGQQTANVQYTAAQVQSARGILLRRGALTTFLGYPNMVQGVSPTATAAVLSRGSRVKFRPAKSAKATKQVRTVKRRLGIR